MPSTRIGFSNQVPDSGTIGLTKCASIRFRHVEVQEWPAGIVRVFRSPTRELPLPTR